MQKQSFLMVFHQDLLTSVISDFEEHFQFCSDNPANHKNNSKAVFVQVK